MNQTDFTHVAIQCARCGNTAASFAALAAAEGKGARSRFERTGFLAPVETFTADFDGALALLARIRAGDLASLAHEDYYSFGFFCRTCGRAYCDRCWSVGLPEFDEGSYDCTHAVCPEGHRQMVDD